MYETKRCPTCRLVLDRDKFPESKRYSPSGLNWQCRECRNAAAREYSRRRRSVVRAKEVRRKLRYPEKIREYKKRDFARHAADRIRTSQNARYLREYGLTIEQVTQWKSTGCCFVCGSRERLRVDHDHESRKVRGLLCHRCNTAAGLLSDSHESAMRLSEYLKHGGLGTPEDLQKYLAIGKVKM